MARRKRASMREGPLADLFRSTVREDEEEPTKQQGLPEQSPTPREEPTRIVDQEQEAQPAPRPEPPQVHEEPEPEQAPPDPERVRAYRVDDLRDIPEPKERLSRIFAEEHDVEGPAYGREEPGLSDYHGPP